MADSETPPRPQVIPPRGGLLHVIDAAGYSLAGLKRLMQETAARLELAGFAAVCVAFLVTGAAFWNWCVFLLLAGLVLVAEALNTAIEVLTDRISPEWSQAAKDAKDLGSLAVGILLLLTSAFVLATLSGLI